MSLPYKTKSPSYTDMAGINDADIWNESYSHTTGDLADIRMFFFRSMANNCRKKTIDDIVPDNRLLGKTWTLFKWAANESYPMEGKNAENIGTEQ